VSASRAGAVGEVDLVVLGGGAAGLTAAREARRSGADVALVQDGPVGGECTFTGCVPSKALIAAAARGDDYVTATASVHRAVSVIAATEDAARLRAEGIAVFEGRGHVHRPDVVKVDGCTVRARRGLIVATGAGPARPPIPGLDRVAVLTNEEIFTLDERPGSLGIIGGGAIGCELAQAFARLGVPVTLLEVAPRLLTREEPEASALVTEALQADGVDVRVGAHVEAVTRSRATVCLDVGDGTPVHVEQLLVATGRIPRARGFGLEDLGVELDDRGAVRTSDTLATTTSGIWAIGDVTARMPFTHAAAAMARVAVANALSRRPAALARRFRAEAIPWVTFTAPEIGRVGLTEADAAEHGGRVAYLPLSEVDRAVATGATRGFVKLIAGPRALLGNLGGGRLLGATVVAPTGGDLVHEAALAMRTGMFAGRLAQTVHAYPTWAVAIQQAAAQLVTEIGGRTARAARR
jgi:pyruvate/2-oxoglutarate dehydrogenase complex dihydrolipoamide dehydrogenase (E3) component